MNTIRGFVDHSDAVDTLEMGKAFLKLNRYDLILLDLHLEDSDKEDTLKEIRALANNAPVIVVTGASGKEVVDSIFRCGAYSCVTKGDSGFIENLKQYVQTALSAVKLRRAFNLI